MFKCSNVQMFKCSNVQMFKYSNVPMFICSNVHMFKCSNAQMFKSSNVSMFKCFNVQMFRCSNVQMFKCSNVQMSNIKWKMSIRLNFCRSVPPEFLRSFLASLDMGWWLFQVFRGDFFPADYSKFGSWLFQDSWLFQVWQTLFLGVSAVPGSPWCSW